ncbi:MAG: hypothetical protein JW862_19420 [Anaerolineales bacterium]|nr:hypothetical protein [Anaerolineales bacterium]
MSMTDDYEEYEDYDDFEGFDLDESEPGGEDAPPQDSGNRTFVIVAAILGAVLVLSLICLVVIGLRTLPSQREAREEEAAAINAQNTAVALASGLTAEAESWTETPTITATPAPVTPTATRTPVLAPTNTPIGPDPTDLPTTATMAALFTAQAEMNLLTTTPVATALPDTGFADNFSIPALISLAAALVVIIFLARRLRTAG